MRYDCCDVITQRQRLTESKKKENENNKHRQPDTLRARIIKIVYCAHGNDNRNVILLLRFTYGLGHHTHTQDTTNTSNWLSDRNGFWALWLASMPTNENINFSWTRAKRTRYREIPQHEATTMMPTTTTTTTSTATKSRNTTKLERVIITTMGVCVYGCTAVVLCEYQLHMIHSRANEMEIESQRWQNVHTLNSRSSLDEDVTMKSQSWNRGDDGDHVGMRWCGVVSSMVCVDDQTENDDCDSMTNRNVYHENRLWQQPHVVRV